MLAFGLSIALFILWAVVGHATLALLYKQDSLLQNMLLAPVVGLAVTVLPIFWLSRAGLPVASFGKSLAIAILLISIALLLKLRPKLPWRDYLPFTGIFFLALYLTGRPMLEFDFDWLSYANDDMANYCLSAQRFLHHGYFDVPDSNSIIQGQEYSLIFWLMYAADGIRPGADLLLAWVCSLTGLTPHQAFMPTILAFHIILISVTGALVYQTRSLRLSAILSCGLLSLSALNSLGTLYQLIAQVSGLALLTGCMTLLMHPFKKLNRKSLILEGILAGLLISSLLVVYPEVLPFLILAFLLYISIGFIRKTIAFKPVLITLAIVFLTNLVLLNTYFLRSAVFIFAQVGKGTKNIDLQSTLFPYFLVPSGLANLWSLQGIASSGKEPWLSLGVFAGALLLVTTAAVALFSLRTGQPTAAMVLIMTIVSLILFSRNNDFGLFKLAMFAQPFLLATLVTWWIGTVRQPSIQLAPLLLIGLISLSTQQQSYVESSRGVGKGGLVEIPNGSQSKINTEFQNLLLAHPSDNLLLDSSNVVMAKFQALYTVDRSTALPSQNFFSTIYQLGQQNALTSWNPKLVSLMKSIGQKGFEAYQTSYFDLLDSKQDSTKNQFGMLRLADDMLLKEAGSRSTLLVSTTSQQDIFNYRRFQDDQKNFVVADELDANNYLIFTHSRLGQHYYGGEARFTSIYQLEKDWFFPGQKISGLGRYFLFEAIRPSKLVRMELNITASLKSDRENELPSAVAIGNQRQDFRIVGRGSAHVFSDPLSPQIINQRSYLGIDMGVDGKRFPSRRSGLMNLYGKDIPLDRRQLVGFGRDISLVSETEYENLSPPTYLKTFPADLANPDLEYSGMYEDGWVSEAAFFNLKQPSSSSPLILQGLVPEIKDSAFNTELVILVDGQEAVRQTLKPGKFDIKLTVPDGKDRRRIDLRFSEFQSLPKGDDRPVAAQLKFIGFKENG